MQVLFSFKIHTGDFRNTNPIIRDGRGFRIGKPDEHASYLTNREVEEAKRFFGERLNGYILAIHEVNQ